MSSATQKIDKKQTQHINLLALFDEYGADWYLDEGYDTEEDQAITEMLKLMGIKLDAQPHSIKEEGDVFN